MSAPLDWQAANEGPLFTEAEPELSPFTPAGSPMSPTLSESNGTTAVFSTTNNNKALARARAARLSRSSTDSSNS